MVCDWAMKFLPRKYREGQTFGKMDLTGTCVNDCPKERYSHYDSDT